GAARGGGGDDRVADDPGVEGGARRRRCSRQRRGAARRDPGRSAAGGERDVPALRASDAGAGHRARPARAGGRRRLRAGPADAAVAAMVDAAKTGAWDIAFLGIDPAREGEIAFSAAYLEIDATYLVPAGSPLRGVGDVDRAGLRVAAPARANYELFLSRHLKSAELVRAANAEAAFELVASGQVDALAGVGQALIGAV